MIRNDAELAVTRQQLDRAERALRSLREEVEPHNPARFRLMAESYIDMIQRLRAAVDAYLGVVPVRARGVIREVDLDRQTFVLRKRPEGEPELDCVYGEPLEDRVKSCLDQWVTVRGLCRPENGGQRPVVQVDDIEASVPGVGRA